MRRINFLFVFGSFALVHAETKILLLALTDKWSSIDLALVSRVEREVALGRRQHEGQGGRADGARHVHASAYHQQP